MDTKALAFGIIGFLLGGLVVSIAATQQDHGGSGGQMSMSQPSSRLQGRSGDNFDAAFLTAMVEHHRGAIGMAKLAEGQAKHKAVKRLSREIISAQRKEIAQMKRWQHQWGYADAMGSMNSPTP